MTSKERCERLRPLLRTLTYAEQLKRGKTSMTEKQEILNNTLKRMQQFKATRQEKKYEFERGFYAYVERTYNEDMTAKDPYNKPENVIEGKEVRIEEEGQGP